MAGTCNDDGMMHTTTTTFTYYLEGEPLRGQPEMENYILKRCKWLEKRKMESDPEKKIGDSFHHHKANKNVEMEESLR